MLFADHSVYGLMNGSLFITKRFYNFKQNTKDGLSKVWLQSECQGGCNEGVGSGSGPDNEFFFKGQHLMCRTVRTSTKPCNILKQITHP